MLRTVLTGFLAIILSCGDSHSQCLGRVRTFYVPAQCLPPATTPIPSLPHYEYESCHSIIEDLGTLIRLLKSLDDDDPVINCALSEEVILKLVNALIYTATQNCRGSGHVIPDIVNGGGAIGGGIGVVGGAGVAIGGVGGAVGAIGGIGAIGGAHESNEPSGGSINPSPGLGGSENPSNSNKTAPGATGIGSASGGSGLGLGVGLGAGIGDLLNVGAGVGASLGGPGATGIGVASGGTHDNHPSGSVHPKKSDGKGTPGAPLGHEAAPGASGIGTASGESGLGLGVGLGAAVGDLLNVGAGVGASL